VSEDILDKIVEGTNSTLTALRENAHGNFPNHRRSSNAGFDMYADPTGCQESTKFAFSRNAGHSFVALCTERRS